MFLDETTIEVISGHGGNGKVSFRTEKYIPNGGPDGGDGGRGGHVYLRVNEQFTTLLDMGNWRKFKAEHGQHGGTSCCTGKSGAHRYIDVPKGTLVKNQDGDILADLTEPGQTWLAAEGGRGGLGNIHFKSSTNQTPQKATPGGPSIRRIFNLELKLMADIGLVGFPNAGKSSLVNKISSARPKIGDYPFTTLEPVLGIVQVGAGRSFVLADIPGLIEGAAQGKGLGHTFLKHIERTHTLLFIIDGFEPDAWEKYQILRQELEDFHPLLAKKNYLIALNKSDLGISETLETFQSHGEQPLVISAVTGEGCSHLIQSLTSLLPKIAQKGW